MADDVLSLDHASLSPEYVQPSSSLEDDSGPPDSPHHELSSWDELLNLSAQRSTEKLSSLESDTYENILRSPKLTSLWSAFADELEPQDPSCIDFTNRPYVDIHAIVAQLTIPENSVTQLVLPLCRLGDSGIETLATAFDSEYCQVEICNFANNRITAKGFGHLIQHITLSHHRLNHLNISGNPIKDVGVQYLSEALKNNSAYLNHIDVCYCEMGEDGIAMIAESLNHIHDDEHKISLSLGGNLCGSEKAVTSIANLLQAPHCCIVELNLMKSQLTDASMNVLIPALYANASLQRLDLFGHDFSANTLKRLETVLQYNASLMWLRLSETQLTPTMINALTRNQANQRLRYSTLFHQLSTILLPAISAMTEPADGAPHFRAIKRQRRQ